MARFQNCVMLFKMAARFPDIWAARGHFGTSIMANKIQKDPVFGSSLSLSPTPYIIHWSRWQLFCMETGPKLKQTAILC